MTGKITSLIVSLALTVAAGVALPGCKSDPDPARQVAVTANLHIAPIADDHPWVIAFLTETSIAQPSGVEARLEGHSTPNGTFVPEPIFEAETREALATLLTTYEQTHTRPPELSPIWEPDPFGPGQAPNWRMHFIDRPAGFSLDANAKASIERDEYVGAKVILRLSPAQAPLLEQLTGEHVGHRIAVVVDDEALMVPVVRSAIAGGEVQMIGSANQDPAVAAQALLDRLRP